MTGRLRSVLGVHTGPVESSRLYSYLPSPLGELLLARHAHGDGGEPGGLTALYLSTGRHAATQPDGWQREDDAFADVAQQLAEYFGGARREFDLPLSPSGTVFQKQVWAALLEIPYGQTTSYGALAADIGSPSASRAVGLANGQNPISIVVPCHRVVGANGALTGYGGGLPAKRWLLTHELTNAGLFA
jgi:methylated-DNA-[protein]-cysteine S-methyltransferase